MFRHPFYIKCSTWNNRGRAQPGIKMFHVEQSTSFEQFLQRDKFENVPRGTFGINCIKDDIYYSYL